MYRYVSVDLTAIRKRLAPSTIYAWVPAQVIRFSECRPKELYIVDCFFSSLIDNPYTSLILLRKIPKPKNVKISDIPSVDVRRLNAECRDFVSDLNRIVNDVMANNYSNLYELLDTVSEYRDMEIAVRYFIRTRKYVIKAEQIRELDRRLAVRIAEKLVRRLCLYDEKERKRLFTPANIDKYYVLIYIDPTQYTSGIALGKDLIEVKTYLKLIKKMNLEDLFFLKSQELSPDTHYQNQLHS